MNDLQQHPELTPFKIIVDDGQTYSNDTLVCPHCGHRESDSQEIFTEIEETIYEHICSNCDTAYIAERRVIFCYTGKPLMSTCRIPRTG